LEQTLASQTTVGDFAVVNLETQIAITEPTTKAPKPVTCFSAPETLEVLSWAGIDYVTLVKIIPLIIWIQV
jgi:hypothetical protein